MVLLIGTRGSNLATTQSTHVMEGIHAAGFDAELHIVRTPGDDSQTAQTPVRSIGVGVFTETLRTALSTGECDIAVHSFKDLPTAADPRFRTVVPPRVDAREVLVSRGNKMLMELPKGAKVGTGAPRRVSQIRAARPDLELLPLRGNIETRMRRTEEDLDAVVLARAGLERVGLLDKSAESIDPNVVMPAPAQGALSVEVRADDDEAWDAVVGLDHLPSHVEATAERALLATLEAGCTAPVGARAVWSDEPNGVQLTLTGGVFALDGTDRLVRRAAWDTSAVQLEGWQRFKAGSKEHTEVIESASRLGRAVGLKLLDSGASRLVATAF